jgi:hypothetical protein
MRSKRETFWERLLASTVVIYTFCATFIVYKELRQYGTNWVLFFIIDVPTSWFYGIAVTRLVVSVIKKQSGQIQKWGLIAALNFGLPQLYILISTKKAPHSVYLIIYGVIVVLALFALGGVYSQIKSARTNEGARNHK